MQKSIGNNQSVVYKNLQAIVLALALTLSGTLIPAIALTLEHYEKSNQVLVKSKLYKKLKNRYETRYGVDLLSPYDLDKNSKLQALDDGNLWSLMCLAGKDFEVILAMIEKNQGRNQSLFILRDELKTTGVEIAAIVQSRIDNGGFAHDLKCES